MKHEVYTKIKQYLGELTSGTEWEGRVYAVGGCVRDELMGSEIKDIDLCVSLPGGGIRFAQWLRENGQTTKGVTVYPNYGTAMLHLKAFPDVELEFVQTRKEKYIDHSCRNPETAFGTIDEDCMRRDLTINALYCNVSTGEIVDITGKGVADIRNHVIRTPATPDLTYDDDPLRILRCIRFASRYGWEIEQDTFDGMVRNVPRLAIITKERVKDELDKMLACQHPVMAMELLRRTGAMHYVVPELEETYGMTQNEYHFGTVWEHTLAVVGNLKSDRLELRMAALLHDIGKIRTRTVGQTTKRPNAQTTNLPNDRTTNLPNGQITKRPNDQSPKRPNEAAKVHFLEHELASADMVNELLRPLKYSNEFIKEVTFLVKHHMVCKTWGRECEHIKAKKLRRLQYECGTEERFRHLMLLIDADNNAHAADRCMPRQVERILQRTEEMKQEGSAMFGYKLPLTGKDVMEIKGIKPGPQVRQCLDYLLKLAFVNPLRDKDEVIKHLKGYRLQE